MNSTTPFNATQHGRAFLKVFDLLWEDSSSHSRGSATWLSALALIAKVKEDSTNGQSDWSTHLRQQRSEEFWINLRSRIGIGADFLPSPARPAIHEEVIAITIELVKSWGHAKWEFFDSSWYVYNKGYDFPFTLSPEMADLAADGLGEVGGKYAWCLFNGSFQIAYRLAKKGAVGVVLTDDSPFMRYAVRVLNWLHHTTVRCHNPLLDSLDENTVPYDVGVAVPPFGLRELPNVFDLAMFNSEPSWPGQNKPEIMAVRALWERVAGKSVIVAPPSLLFSIGQERQAREYMVFGLNAVDSVVNLPARQTSGSSISLPLLFLKRERQFNQPIRFIDASDQVEREGRTGVKMHSIDRIASLVCRGTDHADWVRDVQPNDLHASDVSLYPPRYFGTTFFPGETIGLGDIVQAIIRPPAKPMGRDEGEAEEINISDLHEWGYVGNQTKTKAVKVRQTKLQSSRLQADDIVVSIKGSIGKVGIFRATEHENVEEVPYVVSQSCVALRLSAQGKQRVPPIVLYMYLRSPLGKAVFDALNVGAVISHIQPASLIEQLKIPVLPILEQEKLVQTFQAMANLQREIQEKQDELDKFSRFYWPMEDLK
jgi:type I restriction enzyme M protein